MIFKNALNKYNFGKKCRNFIILHDSFLVGHFLQEINETVHNFIDTFYGTCG